MAREPNSVAIVAERVEVMVLSALLVSVELTEVQYQDILPNAAKNEASQLNVIAIKILASECSFVERGT